jgi:hypothetical protein
VLMATRIDDMDTAFPLPKPGKRIRLDDDVKPLPNPKPAKPGEIGKTATPYKKSGTNEGTDQASAEKNLRQDFENMKADERQKKAREAFDKAPPMKKGGKVKKYADGGMTQQPTYPFYGNQPQAGGQNGGTNQTFNMQPQANAAPNPQQQPMQQTFKNGGKVSSASKRADGCAIRGKTRA